MVGLSEQVTMPPPVPHFPPGKRTPILQFKLGVSALARTFQAYCSHQSSKPAVYRLSCCTFWVVVKGV